MFPLVTQDFGAALVLFQGFPPSSGLAFEKLEAPAEMESETGPEVRTALPALEKPQMDLGDSETAPVVPAHLPVAVEHSAGPEAAVAAELRMNQYLGPNQSLLLRLAGRLSH